MTLPKAAYHHGCSTATIRDAEFDAGFIPVEAATLGKRHVSRKKSLEKNYEKQPKLHGLFPWYQEKKVGPKSRGLPQQRYPRSKNRPGLNVRNNGRTHRTDTHDAPILNRAIAEMRAQRALINNRKFAKVQFWLSSLKHENASRVHADFVQVMRERKALVKSLQLTCARLTDNRKSLYTYCLENSRVIELRRFGGRVPKSSADCRNANYDERRNRSIDIIGKRFYISNGFLVEEDGRLAVNSKHVMDQRSTKFIRNTVQQRNDKPEERFIEDLPAHVIHAARSRQTKGGDRLKIIRELRQQLDELQIEVCRNDRNKRTSRKRRGNAGQMKARGQLKDDNHPKYNAVSGEIIIKGEVRRVERACAVTEVSPMVSTVGTRNSVARNPAERPNNNQHDPSAMVTPAIDSPFLRSFVERTVTRFLSPPEQVSQMDTSVGNRSSGNNGNWAEQGNEGDAPYDEVANSSASQPERLRPLEIPTPDVPVPGPVLLSPAETIDSVVKAFQALERLSPGRDIRELFEEFARLGNFGVPNSSGIEDSLHVSFADPPERPPTAPSRFELPRHCVQTQLNNKPDYQGEDDSDSSDDDSDSTDKIIRLLRLQGKGKVKKRSKEEKLSRKAAKLTKKLLDAATRLKVKALKKEDIPLQHRMKFQAFANSIIPVLRTDSKTNQILTYWMHINHEVTEEAKMAFHSLLHTDVEDHYRNYLQLHPDNSCLAFEELRQHCAQS
ncbi:MAG: hypothetical protein ACRDL7_01065, partial [Gaiellaceae bacterium]